MKQNASNERSKREKFNDGSGAQNRSPTYCCYKKCRVHSKNQFTCIQFRVQFIIKCYSCIQLPYAKSFKMNSVMEAMRAKKKKKQAKTEHTAHYTNTKQRTRVIQNAL